MRTGTTPPAIDWKESGRGINLKNGSAGFPKGKKERPYSRRGTPTDGGGANAVKRGGGGESAWGWRGGGVI